MFEINTSIVDALIFAMEDQDTRRVVKVEDGSVLLCGPETEGEAFVSLPSWSSREGFRLMEDFLKTVRSPGPRRELTSALNRGRGVFKAFKEVLNNFPEVDKAFHDFKLRAMKAIIRAWYDDIREVQGLERLGPEPEETNDLIRDDFGIEVGAGASHRGSFLDLAEALIDEVGGLLPSAIIARESALLRASLEEEDWLGAWIEDGEGGLIAAAAAERESEEGWGMGRFFFIYVVPEFRRCGIGRALLSSLGEAFRREGNSILLFDLAFLPDEFAHDLETNGLRYYGCRGYFQP